MESLFDLRPKTDPRYLYARGSELETLLKNIKRGNWTVLLGPRRVGKTSLAFCSAKRTDIRSIYIDARENDDLRLALLNGLSPRSDTVISGGAGPPTIPISASLSVSRKKRKLGLDDVLENAGDMLLLLDEAQWLKNPVGVSRLLAHIYDLYKGSITLIVTGSSVGVMQSLLNPGPKGAMFGRSMTEMHIGKWRNSSIGMSFLKEGCEQEGVNYELDDLENAVERLDGLPGWLTLFGNYYRDHGNFRSAYELTIEQAMKVVADELESTSRLALGWQRQMMIMNVIANGEASFSQLADKTILPDAVLDRNLKMLMRLEYIEKNEDGRYQIVDPVVREYLMKGGRNK